MTAELPPDDAGPLPSYADRTDQLVDLKSVCRRLAAVLMIHGHTVPARRYAASAVRAEELLAHGFAQPDLDQLAAQFPPAPAWLGPDAGPAPREGWEAEAVRLHDLAWTRAADLRETLP